MKIDNPRIIRGIVACLLWFFIIGCFFITLRTSVVVQSNIDRLKGKSITPNQFKDTQLAGETAKAFIAEWATFDQSRLDEYQQRLAQFGKKDETINPGKGTQRCNDVSILETVAVNDDQYRVKASTFISRLVTVTADKASGIPESRVQSKKAGDNYTSSTVSYWEDSLQTVEVSLQIKNGAVQILGWPVIVSNPNIQNYSLTKYFDNDEAPKDFAVFSEQMLDMYYSGKDLKNYCVSDTTVNPVGEYTFKHSEIQGIKKDGDKITALIKATISTTSIEESEQLLILEAQKKDNKWYLVRLGAY